MTVGGPVPSTDWNPDALKEFCKSRSNGLHPDDTGGKKGQSFAQGLKGVTVAQLPTGKIKRSRVFSMAADLSSVNTVTVCAAVMAWGGMRETFSKRFFSLADQGWLDTAEKIRAGSLDRKAAYCALSDLRQKGKLTGAGPAYFTKLIYFLMPRKADQKNHAYIMDQWAGCSVNLLVGRELVKMNVTRQWHIGKPKPVFDYQVSEANSGADYEAFCSAIDDLRQKFNITPDQIDRSLVANGGRNKSSWRRYVIENRHV